MNEKDDRPVFVSIGINTETCEIGIVGFSRSMEDGKRKEVERQGEEGVILPHQETFEIRDDWSADVRKWLRHECDLSLNEVQQACEAISEVVVSMMDSERETPIPCQAVLPASSQ